MPYNFYTLDHTGAITGPTTYVACVSDRIALSKAENMVGNHVTRRSATTRGAGRVSGRFAVDGRGLSVIRPGARRSPPHAVSPPRPCRDLRDDRRTYTPFIVTPFGEGCRGVSSC
jgi:hypothetical protein